jgi:hypothetical protein
MRRFTPKLGLGFLGAAGWMALASNVSAIDHSVPAHAGHAWLPTEINCFTTPSFSNKVTNTCPNPRSWLVPITTHRAGVPISASHQVFASSAGAGTAPSCRIVYRTAADGSGSVGAPVNVNGATASLGTVTITPGAGESLHVDCLLAQNGKALTSVNWFIP